MDAAQKSFEVQAMVRQNAEAVKNTLNDLYNWEKEIKDKEKKVQNQSESSKEVPSTILPIRSHLKELEALKKSVSRSEAATPIRPLTIITDEKVDTPNDPLASKHKEANEIKELGNRHVKLTEYEKAIEAYTRAIELYDNDAVYYCNRALCYLKLERYDECIEDCESAIEIDRLAVKAYYRRMMANESLGNNMDALKDCTTVLMIEPKNTEAKRSLERINERLRKNVQTKNGPNFTPLRENLVDILPIEKPPHKRSTKPLSRLAIADVIGPKESKNYENLTISDDDIDKLFNSNCGHFEEIKISDSLEDNAGKNAERALPPVPTSPAQFYANWKELTQAQKYVYLKNIPVMYLRKVLGTFGVDFNLDTLTDLLNTLHNFYLLENHPNTAGTLFQVSEIVHDSHTRTMVLAKEQHEVLTKIMESLKATDSVDDVWLQKIAENFCLNHESQKLVP